jgi:hypothetical protein
MNSKYYISTGAKGCYYTLRYTFTQSNFNRGTGEVYTTSHDYFVRNLSTDRDSALKKASEYTKQGLEIDFDLNDINRRSEVDHSIFQAGKYAGMSIHEVRETDPNYLLWVAENLGGSAPYNKTVELIRDLMAHEIAVRNEENAEKVRQSEAAQTVRMESLKEILSVLDKQNNSFFTSLREQLVHGPLSHRQAECVVKLFKMPVSKMKKNERAEYHSKLDEVYNLLVG